MHHSQSHGSLLCTAPIVHLLLEISDMACGEDIAQYCAQLLLSIFYLRSATWLAERILRSYSLLHPCRDTLEVMLGWIGVK